MRRRIAVAGTAVSALIILLTPAYLATDCKPQAPSQTYTERPTITVVFPPGSMHRPSEELSEPRKDRT